MANYKLVNSDQLDLDLTSVADKIREKAEISTELAFPSEFISGIDQCSSLNFKVVGGTSEPSDPAENTIWINTDTEITSWIFSPTEPTSPVEGMVWISTGLSSDFVFNALKNNAIQIYIKSGKQYISSAWANVGFAVYQGGAWAESASGYLFNAGDECTDITGGWTSAAYFGGDYYKGTYSNSNGVMSVDSSEYSTCNIAVRTVNKIDLADYDTLTINVSERSGYSNSGFLGAYLCITDDRDILNTAVSMSEFTAYVGITTTGEVSLDISSYTSEYYVFVFTEGAKVGFTEVHLE